MKRVFITLIILVGTLGVFAAPISFDYSNTNSPTLNSQIAFAANENAGVCDSWLRFFSGGLCTVVDGVNGIKAIVGTTLLEVAGLFLWFSGVFFNTVITIGVVKFGAWVKDLVGITIAWTMIRDLANMTFIFMLLYMSISTILQLDSYSMKRNLAKLVVVALLINFSLFATRFVIDTSNIIANQFYEGIVSFNKDADSGAGQIVNNGISGAIMQHTRLATLYVKPGSTANEALQEWINTPNMFTISIMGALFVSIFAFVLFAAAIMFAYRIVSLIVLMILSPAAFVAMAFPNMSGVAKRWWKELLNQSFFAPVYLAMLLLVISIIGHPTFKEGLNKNLGVQDSHNLEGVFSGIINGATSTFAVVINYIIIIGLTVSALLVAKSMGARGSEKVIKWGNAARGFAGRQTLGRAANRIANNRYLNNRADSGGVISKTGSRLILRNADTVAGASFGGAKGGFKKSLKDQTKQEKVYAETAAKGKAEAYAAELERQRIQDNKKNLNNLTESDVIRGEISVKAARQRVRDMENGVLNVPEEEYGKAKLELESLEAAHQTIRRDYLTQNQSTKTVQQAKRENRRLANKINTEKFVEIQKILNNKDLKTADAKRKKARENNLSFEEMQFLENAILQQDHATEIKTAEGAYKEQAAVALENSIFQSRRNAAPEVRKGISKSPEQKLIEDIQKLQENQKITDTDESTPTQEDKK